MIFLFNKKFENWQALLLQFNCMRKCQWGNIHVLLTRNCYEKQINNKLLIQQTTKNYNQNSFYVCWHLSCGETAVLRLRWKIWSALSFLHRRPLRLPEHPAALTAAQVWRTRTSTRPCCGRSFPHSDEPDHGWNGATAAPANQPTKQPINQVTSGQTVAAPACHTKMFEAHCENLNYH